MVPDDSPGDALTLALVALDTPERPDGPDVAGIRAVLQRHGLRSDGRIGLIGPPLGPATFETSYLGPEARSFYGQIFSARPDAALSELVFELAVAGPLLLTVAPGPPHIVVCGSGFAAEDVTDESVPPWLEVVAIVDKPTELHAALTGGWRPFRSTFADRYWTLPESFPG